jgi:hypothetical protein
MAAAPHPIVTTALNALGDAPSFSDDGLGRVLRALDALIAARGKPALLPAAGALVSAATVLATEVGRPEAARTLLAIVAFLEPQLRAVDVDAAQAVLKAATDAGEAFQAFAGDKGVSGPLGGGVRPEGTTRAGPLSRFAMLQQLEKPGPPKSGSPR